MGIEKKRQLVPGTEIFFDLILIEAGSFMMGSTDADSYADELIIHPDTLASFYLAQYPVTQALWLAVIGGENPANFPGLQRPVERVSWFDAAAFCNRLNVRCGYAPMYYTDAALIQPLDMETAKKVDYPNIIDIYIKPEKIGYCLPSEAQWEYAARGGKDPDQRPAYKYAGGDKLDEVGWYCDNSHDETKPVGLKLPNELGIYDMSGNVLEWCEDQWHDSYKGAPDDGSAWLGLGQGVSRVLRGGYWYGNPHDCRSSSRNNLDPADRSSSIGFRVVLFSPPGSWSAPSQ